MSVSNVKQSNPELSYCQIEFDKIKCWLPCALNLRVSRPARQDTNYRSPRSTLLSDGCSTAACVAPLVALALFWLFEDAVAPEA